eukprot:m.451956 g.451956  ORF g.451956 m.451956 type:complete len:100 (+) comp20240_c0_seq1:676-975(+)
MVSVHLKKLCNHQNRRSIAPCGGDFDGLETWTSGQTLRCEPPLDELNVMIRRGCWVALSVNAFASQSPEFGNKRRVPCDTGRHYLCGFSRLAAFCTNLQ